MNRPDPIVPFQKNIEDIEVNTRKIVMRFLPYFLAGLVVVIIIAIYLISHGNSDWGFYLITYYVGIAGTFYGYIWGNINSQFRKEIAKELGYAYGPKANMDSVSGPLFRVGRAGPEFGNRQIKDVISGTYQNKPIRIYTFSADVGRHEHYGFTVLELTFDTNLPEIILRRIQMVLTDGGRKEVIGLEEKYQKYFRLYAPDGYEIEVLQIFDMDLLDYLIEYANDLNIELSKNKMYIYTQKIVSNKKQLMYMFELTKRLSEHLGPFLHRMKDDFEALRPYYKT